MYTTSCPCYHQCDFFLYFIHPLHPSLPATPLSTVPLLPFIHSSSIHAPNLPHNSPAGNTIMCRGACRCPNLSRQPVVLGGKEVGNGVGSGEELYADNGYDYYTNQGISQWLGLIFVKLWLRWQHLVFMLGCFSQFEVRPPLSCWWTDRSLYLTVKKSSWLLHVHSVNSFIFACQIYCITHGNKCTFYE